MVVIAKVVTTDGTDFGKDFLQLWWCYNYIFMWSRSHGSVCLHITLHTL